jgi:GTPase SAR1 family protein
MTTDVPVGPDPGLPDPGLPDPGLPDPGLPDPGLPDPGLPDGPGPAGVRLSARQSQALLGAVRLLRTHGNAEMADLALQRVRSTGRRRPTVVVVGEVKRGKSSLVNALIGVPSGSPVGVDVTTATFVRFVPPSATRPVGSAAVFTADGTRIAIDAADVAAWVSVGGARREDLDAPLAIGAEVTADGPLLARMSLVDTPGVGGLDGGHARLAAQAAAQATALLMVCDAGTPLTAPELDFLTGTAATVDTVVLAMTKIDLYPNGWREVLAENRALLRRHAPRFADVEIIGVSSQLAVDADLLGDEQTRRVMREVAGIDRLTAVLLDRSADVAALTVANGLRIARSGLDQLTVQLTARRNAVTGGAARRADLEAERARLGDLRARQQRWTLDLERDLGHLRRAAVDDIAARLTELRDRWTQLAEKERRGLVPSVTREFTAEVCSELLAVAQEVTARFDEHLRALVADTYGLAGGADDLLADAPRELREVRPRAKDPGGRPTGLLDPSLAATAFLGAGIATKIPMVAAAGIGLPVSLAIGGAWLAVNVAFRAVKAGRTRLRTWLVEVTQALQSDLVAATDGCLREVKPEIVVGFRQFLTAAVAELDAVIREADRAAAAGTDERRQRVDALDRHLAAVSAQQIALDAVLRDISAPAAGTSGSAAESNLLTPPPAISRQET